MAVTPLDGFACTSTKEKDATESSDAEGKQAFLFSLKCIDSG